MQAQLENLKQLFRPGLIRAGGEHPSEQMPESRELIMTNLSAANKILTRRILLVWVAAIGLYFVALADISILSALARWTGRFVPAVQQQFDKGTPLGYLAGCYAGLAALLLPFAASFMLWRQDIPARVFEGTQRSGRGWRFIVFNYLFGLPFALLILLSVYFAPIDTPRSPQLFGQVVIYAMTNNYFGLLFLGSLLIVGTSLLLFLLSAFLSLPILLLIRWIKVK